MSLNDAQRIDSARHLAHHIYGITDKTADLNLNDLKAAIGSIDDTMDLTPGSLNVALTVKQNFLDLLLEPFKSTATNVEKALALKLWADKETGVI